MTTFRYTAAAQRIVFGAGSVSQLPVELDAGGWSRVMLVTSPHYARAGVADALHALLGSRMVARYHDAAPHVPEATVHAALDLARVHRADAIVALGGGSAVGLAKAVAMARTAEQGAGEPPVVSVAVPTTYSGSEMTPVYGVTRPQPDGSTRKVTVRDPRIPPALVLYDPELTYTLPADLTASTGVNALAHGIEATYSRTRNALSSAAALSSIRLIGAALPACITHGTSVTHRAAMLEGAHLGGVALATVDMGLHHGTGHVLGGSAGVPHGVANCIVLPHAVRFNADVCAAPLAQVADALGITRDGRSDEALAHAAAEALHAWIGTLGQPQRLRDVGVVREQLPVLAEALLASAAVSNNPKPLGTHNNALAYLEEMW